MCHLPGSDLYRSVLQRQKWLTVHHRTHVAAVVLCDVLLTTLWALVLATALGVLYLLVVGLGFGWTVLIAQTRPNQSASDPHMLWGVSFFFGLVTALILCGLGIVGYAVVVLCVRCIGAPDYTMPARQKRREDYESVSTSSGGDDDSDVKLDMQ